MQKLNNFWDDPHHHDYNEQYYSEKKNKHKFNEFEEALNIPEPEVIEKDTKVKNINQEEFNLPF